MRRDGDSSPDTSRAQQWVTDLKTEGTELHEQLAANYQYYLDHVGELETGELTHDDLPELGMAERSAMHAATMFGLSWAKEASLYVVVDGEHTYIDVFGREANADTYADERPGHTVLEVKPTGKDPQDDIQDMQAGESVLLPKIGDCLEHLFEHDSEFHTGDAEAVVEAMPHFEENVKWLIASSALFGRIWEFSDPALWVVLGPNDEFEGLYASARRAAEATQNTAGHRTEAITPRDNIRHANANVPEAPASTDPPN